MTTEPKAPAAAAPVPPPAINNLNALEAEAKGTARDTALAAEIDQVQAAGAAAQLTEEERRQAAAAGAVMGFAFAETLLGVGLDVTGVDDGTRAAVKKAVDAGRAGVVDSLAPVLAKYQAEPPAAVAKFKEELMLAFRIIMLCVGVYMAIKKGKAAVAAAAKPAPAQLENAAAA